MTPFGVKIRELRAKKGIKQAEMAAELEVSSAYLSALEHGKKGAPSWALLQKIIQYFGLIWDEAEALKTLADLSRPIMKIDTSGLDPKATEAANLMAMRIAHLPEQDLDALLAILRVGDPPD